MRNRGRQPPGDAPASRRATVPLRLSLPEKGATGPSRWQARTSPPLLPAPRQWLPTPPLGPDGQPDLSGHVLGNWRVQQRLGAGAFGVVYEAQNAAIAGRLAAIKVLHPHLSVQPEIKRRFINEASAASRAEHENIIQVFDGGITDDGICYLVMELLKGVPLRDVLADQRLGPLRAVRIARQVARALGAAHREGIVHRDLKPDNVFLIQRSEEREFVKVLDFGIAKLAADAGGGSDEYRTRTGVWLGTPAYMSPEQWQTLPDIDRRADVYALGVILFEMLTGRAPYRGPTQFVVMMAHLDEAVPSAREHVPSVPASLSRLVQKMMAKRREQRPQAMGDVIDALSAIEGDLRASVSGGSGDRQRPSDDLQEGFAARGESAPAGRHRSDPSPDEGPGGRPQSPTTRLRTVAAPEEGVVATPDELRRSLDRDPYRIEPYRALHRQFLERGETDAAWCAAAVLSFLQRANPAEKALFDSHRSARVPVPGRALGDAAWEKLLMHPDEDPTVGAIFAAISHRGALLRSVSLRELGVKRSGRIDPGAHGSLFARCFSVAVRVLEPIVPDLYLRPDGHAGMRVAQCRDGSVASPILFVASDLLADTRGEELAFRLGRLLTMLRPERYPRLLFPTSLELRTLFLAVLKLASPGLVLPGADAPQVDQLAQRLAPSLDASIRELLARAVLGLPRTPVDVYLSRWSQAVELTAHRAGLLLCNDLAVAARLIENEPSHATGFQADRVGELLRFAVSESYLTLRRQLGIALG